MANPQPPFQLTWMEPERSPRGTTVDRAYENGHVPMQEQISWAKPVTNERPVERQRAGKRRFQREMLELLHACVNDHAVLSFPPNRVWSRRSAILRDVILSIESLKSLLHAFLGDEWKVMLYDKENVTPRWTTSAMTAAQEETRLFDQLERSIDKTFTPEFADEAVETRRSAHLKEAVMFIQAGKALHCRCCWEACD